MLRTIIVKSLPAVAAAALSLPAHGQHPHALPYHAAGPSQPYLTLEEVSPYFEKRARPKQVMMHDVITIVVQERAAIVSGGQVDRRKNGLYDAVIRDWVNLQGLSLKGTPQRDGEPAAGGTIRQTYRSEAQLNVQERLEFRIAATVVDIRPNGNLVVEAHRNVRINGETWQSSLTGIVRPEDVLPNNTVLSEDVAELSVFKRQEGHVRDSYRRGWVTKLLDKLNPF